MTITKKQDGSTLELALAGRLDTNTAPVLENCIKTDTVDSTLLIMDFAELEYVSSAGLRVLLSAQKLMKNKGKMILRNVCEDIMDVFEITGFADILTIE